MVAPIPFLERLLPGIVGHGAVQAALPPRFAPAPLDESPGELVSHGPVADRVAVSRDRPPPRSERPLEHERLPQALQEDRAPQPWSAPPPGISPAPQSRSEIADQAPPVAPRTVVLTSPGPVGSLTVRRAEPDPLLGGGPERRSSIREIPDANTILGTRAVPPLFDARPPLREPVVRQSAAIDARFAPTEIHVTIDRIDVRAPAATNGGAPRPASRPRTAPSLSLADYLRQREQPGKSGGTR